jgi:hypothetical protein
VDVNASPDSISPRFAVEAHLEGLFAQDSSVKTLGGEAERSGDEPRALAHANDQYLLAENATRKVGSPGPVGTAR